MRVALYLEGLAGDAERRAAFESDLLELADRFQMTWRISYPGEAKRAYVMASEEDHCLPICCGATGAASWTWSWPG